MRENKVIELYVKANKAYLAFLKANYGDRCPDYSPGCPICEQWVKYDLIFNGHDLPKKVTKKGGKRATKKSKTR